VNKYAHYHDLAELFDYPLDGYSMTVERVLQSLAEACPDAMDDLRRFSELLPVESLRAMQELFTRSFDVQAITTLDLGYVLFGDDYKRGEMLANLNREHLQAGIDCGTELADHLPNILRLLAVLEDQDLVTDLVDVILAPALRGMIGEFSADRVQKRNVSYRKHYKTLIDTPAEGTQVATLYQFALKSLYQVMKQDFVFTESIPLKVTTDFLDSVRLENEIEERANA
jgi:nitrate reductase assembly molybdenum cofactor insertion protein NarJ